MTATNCGIILSDHFSAKVFTWCFHCPNKAGLPLNACRFIAWLLLGVSELQLSAATPLWSFHRAVSLWSWIEVNCLRSAAVGKVARLSIDWLDAAHAWSSLCGHQSGNVASSKLVWKQYTVNCQRGIGGGWHHAIFTFLLRPKYCWYVLKTSCVFTIVISFQN